MWPGQQWYTDVGKESYGQKDMAKAKRLLKESGYNGEEVVIASNTTYVVMHNASQVFLEQLRDLGVNARLTLTDWATQLKRRRTDGSKDGDYNFWFGGWPLVASGPTQGHLIFSKQLNFANLSQTDPAMEAGWNALKSSKSLSQQMAAIETIQKRQYEMVYLLHLGSIGLLQGWRSDVKGFEPFLMARFFNVWLE